MKIKTLLVAGGVLFLGGAASYFYLHAGHPNPDETQAGPAAPVSVVVKTLAEEKIRPWTEFSGRLHAVDSAEIRPEVSGRITEVRFEDGQRVKEGDVLFVIDPRPFEAAAARAQAELASAKAKDELAKLEKGRANRLIESNAISRQELDQSENASRVTESAIASAEAALQQARIDLDHAHIKAPISGRISRVEITQGNLVQSGSSAPLLTTIVSDNGIYADFEVDEQTYLQTIRSYASGNEQERLIPVQLHLQADKSQVYEGRIHNFDNRLDTASGTIRARAKFDNADGSLVPGMFVSVRLSGSAERGALIVPERAVSFDQSKKFVYVVDGNNNVSYREIVLGQNRPNGRVVERGLLAGDRVVVDGVQRVKPNVAVAVTELAPETKGAVAAQVSSLAANKN